MKCHLGRYTLNLLKHHIYNEECLIAELYLQAASKKNWRKCFWNLITRTSTSVKCCQSKPAYPKTEYRSAVRISFDSRYTCIFSPVLKCWTWIISIKIWLCLSVSTLDRRRVVAPSMLTDPSQHSKQQKERALCLWWPAPPSIFVDGLVVSSRCQTVLLHLAMRNPY